MSAFIFNLCLLIAPIAAALAFTIIARDGLYAYQSSEAGAKAIRSRIEHLNGELIQLDFDRLRQWDDLVAMELMAEDVSAARGFLLSVRGMAPARYTNDLPANRGDAELEAAALGLLTPGTRARYEATVPLLSRRSGDADARNPRLALPDPEDFELIARALLQDPDTSTVQFVLTGMRLGLGGEMSARAQRGAAALLEASRRDDYNLGLEADIEQMLNEAVPIERFREAALASAGSGDPGKLANASSAFHEAVNHEAMARAMAVLDEIGAMSLASSHEGAVALLTHASGVRDLPKLRVIAEAAGDRAAAAAKRLQRDGRLLAAARGQLTITRELAVAIAAACLALLGLIAIAGLKAWDAVMAFTSRWRDDGDLVEIHTETWRAL